MPLPGQESVRQRLFKPGTTPKGASSCPAVVVKKVWNPKALSLVGPLAHFNSIGRVIYSGVVIEIEYVSI